MLLYNINDKKVFFSFSIILTLVLIYFYSKRDISSSEFKNITRNPSKPKYNLNGTNVIGLVFFGRKRQFSILYHYLVANLKINGGVLNKLIFAVKDARKEDLNYLNKVLKNVYSPYFEKVDLLNTKYHFIYNTLKDDDLVFKIDDDIVFISNGTFEKMLEEYVNNNGFILSANVINHPLLSNVHARMRAILPFKEIENNKWLLDNSTNEIDKTVGYGMQYKVGTCWWKSGRCGALAHESFFYHILRNNLDIYDFKRWDFHYDFYGRWSINFILFKGKIVNKIALEDDEEWISNYLSRSYRRHGYALGSAVVSHFSYNFQKEYLYTTNILDKYDQLSKEYFRKT